MMAQTLKRPENRIMVPASLKMQLAQLREELARSNTLDPDARQALRGVADEIERMLGTSKPDLHSVRERIEATALGFEADHPRFSRLLSEITDALAKLGI
jgi:hypothetical protein